MDSNALEKMSFDKKFPLFTRSLEEASMLATLQPKQDATTNARNATKAVKSAKKSKWTPEQKRQAREQRALQEEQKVFRGRSTRQKPVATEREHSGDGGVSLVSKPDVEDPVKSKLIIATLPVRSARQSSAIETAKSTIQNDPRENRASMEAVVHLPTNAVNLKPNASVYPPINAAPLGSSYIPVHQNSRPFIPYQSLRSVIAFCGLPPWRIDKLRRFASAVATRDPFQPAAKGPSPAKGKWKSLPSRPTRQARFNLSKGFASDNLSSSRLPKGPKVHCTAPKPTAAYLEQALIPSLTRSQLGNLLLVLDINGTLLYRRKKTDVIIPRPSLAEFLNYCLDNHSVLVWSSSLPENVNKMCSKMFPHTRRSQVIAEWGRDTLELSASDYYHNTQVYKRLDRIWDNEIVQMHHPQYDQGGRWNQKNTVLIDDSALKASAQPHNHIEVPEFEPKNNKGNDIDGAEVLGQVVAYLEELRKWEDVSSFMKKERFVLDGGYRWDWVTGQRVCPDMREDL